MFGHVRTLMVVVLSARLICAISAIDPRNCATVECFLLFLCCWLFFLVCACVFSGVSMVWQVGQVPWLPLKGGATQQVLMV